MTTCSNRSAQNVTALSDSEIELVSGAYSQNTCILAWTGMGTLMGAILGGGVGGTVGGLAGAWYGDQVCSV